MGLNLFFFQVQNMRKWLQESQVKQVRIFFKKTNVAVDVHVHFDGHSHAFVSQ